MWLPWVWAVFVAVVWLMIQGHGRSAPTAALGDNNATRVSQKTPWLFGASGSASDAYNYSVCQETAR